jgi:two-component system, LytTR family, sensor kinase
LVPVRLVLVGLTVAALVALPALALLRAVRARRQFGTSEERVTFEVLHAVSEAAPHFRGGLTPAAAARAARSLRRLLACSAVAITDGSEVLAWDGDGQHHAAALPALARPVFEDARPVALRPAEVACPDVGCPIRTGVVVPIEVGGTVVGTLAALGSVKPGTIRAAEEVAGWVAAQIELGRLDQSHARAAAAELRALRAQISPHFVYNALTAIASFVRTDPERARELLLQFAELTRYSFRSQAQFTTLAEELRAIDAYLVLERARFGDRLAVTLRVAPEVLPVTLPFLVLQPLVENAVRHGIERRGGPGRIDIVAEDGGSECHISVEDNGVGMDPEQLRRHLAGDGDAGRIGLANVDERLRAVFGDEFGLVVETAPGAGTRVCLRVPKYRAGVRAS